MSNKDISRKINQLKNLARFGEHRFINLCKGTAIRMFWEGQDTVLRANASNFYQWELHCQILLHGRTGSICSDNLYGITRY